LLHLKFWKAFGALRHHRRFGDISMSNLSLEERIRRSLARGVRVVFLRKDFDRFGSYGQVGRALRALTRQGLLARVGYGIYVKARVSTLTGRPVPVEPLLAIGLEALRRLGVRAEEGAAIRAHAEGRSRQVPMAAVIDVGTSRVRRRIGFGSNVIRYEKSSKE
jgi:hypothetical protein